MKYTIDFIDKYTGNILVTMFADNGTFSQMGLAVQVNGQPFTISNAKTLDTELLASRDNWISQNTLPESKTIDPALVKYTSDAEEV